MSPQHLQDARRLAASMATSNPAVGALVLRLIADAALFSDLVEYATAECDLVGHNRTPQWKLVFKSTHDRNDEPADVRRAIEGIVTK